MPYVRLLVSHTAPCDDVDTLCADLAAALPKVIANALAVPESMRFPPTEVTIDGIVADTPGGPSAEPFDRMSHDVEILVLCDHHPERVESRDKIAQKIIDELDGVLGKASAWAYVRPAVSGFAQRPRKK